MPMASAVASRICRNRTRSSLFIGNQRGADDLIPEVGAQVSGRTEIDFAAGEEAAQFLFHSSEAEEADVVAGLEFDEDIDVAVRPELRSED